LRVEFFLAETWRSDFDMQRKIYLATALVAALSLPAVAYGQTTPEQRLAILNAHNVDRDLHCVPQFQWSDALAANAQAWANQCRKDSAGFFIHQPSNPNGENLSWGYSVSNGLPILPGRSPEEAVRGWYGEISSYNFNNPLLTDANGHFTQVVWRASTQLGCAQATCQISTGSGTTVPGTLWVCEYFPRGNFNATPETLAQNVPNLCN
jgi:uncharacterized protein YkwD